MSEKDAFRFDYDAKKQEEIRKIRDKYIPKEADKLKLLKQLDRSVTRKGTIWSLIVGIVGTLVFGLGLCCVLLWKDTQLTNGILIGVIGLGMIAMAYPLYARITAKEKKRLAPQILALSEELLKS